MISKNNAEDSDLNVQEENDRRGFFTKGIKTILAGVLGISFIRSFSQTNSTKALPGSTLSNKLLTRLYSLKRLVGKPDKNLIQAQIQKLERQFDKPQKSQSHKYENKNLFEKVEQFKSVFALDLDNGIVRLRKNDMEIQKDLNLSQIDAYIDLKNLSLLQTSSDFSPVRVESLLDQAADLLDRGIKDRTEWDEKAIKLIDLILELEEFGRQDELLNQEVQDGFYEQDFNKAKSEFDVQAITLLKATQAATQMNKLLDSKFSDEAIAIQQNSLRRMNSGYYFTGHLSDTKGGEPYHHSVPFDNDLPNNREREMAPIKDHVDVGSLDMSLFNLSVQREMDEIQLRNLESNEQIAGRLKVYQRKKLEWEEKNVLYKAEHDEIIRKTYEYKLASLLSDDGILNYTKRLVPLSERFKEDFEHAWPRLKAAAYGMQVIYQFNEPLPNPKLTGVQFYDKCIVWNRMAINHVVKSNQSQITNTITVSLRNQFSNSDEFRTACEAGEWKFALDKQFFGKKYSVKLLAVSVTIVGLGKSYFDPYNLEGCFGANIVLPQNGPFYHKNGQQTSFDLTGYPLIPSLYIGKVYSTQSNMPPETAGTDIVTNLSPIGEWKIDLIPTTRPFYYERRRNGKIRKVSKFQNIEIDDDGTDTMRADHAETEAAENPKFKASDFFDIRLDLYISYKL